MMVTRMIFVFRIREPLQDSFGCRSPWTGMWIFLPFLLFGVFFCLLSLIHFIQYNIMESFFYFHFGTDYSRLNLKGETLLQQEEPSIRRSLSTGGDMNDIQEDCDVDMLTIDLNCIFRMSGWITCCTAGAEESYLFLRSVYCRHLLAAF